MNQRIEFMRLYRCEKIFRLITEWIFKILIDSMNIQRLCKTFFTNHIYFYFFIFIFYIFSFKEKVLKR